MGDSGLSSTGVGTKAASRSYRLGTGWQTVGLILIKAACEWSSYFVAQTLTFGGLFALIRYVWSLGKGPAGFTNSAIWSSSLGGEAWGVWEQHSILANDDGVQPGAPSGCPRPAPAGGQAWQFGGETTVSWVEGTASFDPTSRKAYVYGGWNEDTFEVGFACGEPVGPRINHGKYFAVLLEIDIDSRSIRAVEAAGGGLEAAGPGKRAYALLHAWTDEKAGSRVLCGYGYSSWNPAYGCYRSIRYFRDLWECSLLPDEGSMSSSADPMGKHNRGRAVAVVLKPGEIVQVLQAYLVSNPGVRKMLGDRFPADRGRGAFVGSIFTPDFTAVEPAEVRLRCWKLTGNFIGSMLGSLFGCSGISARL